MKVTKEVTLLRNFYLGVFFVGVLLIILMHTFDRPELDIFRVPTFIGITSQFNGLDYFPTFKIYQISLITALFSVLVDALCLTNYRSKFLLKLSEISTVVGLAILLLAIFFFSYNFLIIDQTLRATALLYIAFSICLVAVDCLNIKVDERLLSKGTKHV